MLQPRGNSKSFWYSVSLLSVKSTDQLPSCWILDVDVEYELSWAKYHQVNFPLYFSTVHKTTNNLKFQISFCHYQAHNNFTAQQSHYNELPEAIKGSFCGETFMNTRKTAFLQPVITEHSSRGVTLAFVVCQKSFQEASVRSSNQHASA